jgi:hypothetical protein
MDLSDLEFIVPLHICSSLKCKALACSFVSLVPTGDEARALR